MEEIAAAVPGDERRAEGGEASAATLGVGAEAGVGAQAGAGADTGAGVLELRVGAMAAGGGCVAHAPDGRVVFVRHSLPGELVRARVTSETARFLRADAVAVVERSPDRVDPPCPAAGPGGCGGCDWQHVALPAQRRLKSELVSEQLRRLAGVDVPVAVEELPGTPDGLGWRTRVQFAVDGDGRVGMHRHRSHDVHPLKRCLIAHPAVEAVGVEQRSWPGVERVEVEASATGGGAVVVVPGGRGGPRAGIRTSARALPDVEAGLVDGRRVVRPPGAIHHRVLGREFRVSAGVFWQVHPAAPAVLAGAVLDALEVTPGESVADLYAGAGLFAALAAERVGTSGSVVAVERNGAACADARANTADLPQVSVVREAVTPRVVSTGIGRPDVVVLDPAREGAGRDVSAALAALVPAPRRIAYVACDPASLARDLRVFLDAGWRLASLRAFDLFPMTEHVEVLAVVEPPAA